MVDAKWHFVNKRQDATTSGGSSRGAKRTISSFHKVRYLHLASVSIIVIVRFLPL